MNHTVILNSKTTTGQNHVAAATNNLVNGVDMLTFGAGLTSPAAAGATSAAIHTAGGVKGTLYSYSFSSFIHRLSFSFD